MLFENEKEFAEAVRDTVEEYLTEEHKDYTAMVQTTKKNNGVEMVGLTLKAPVSNIAHVIYVSHEYDLVNSGELSFDQAVLQQCLMLNL